MDLKVHFLEFDRIKVELTLWKYVHIDKIIMSIESKKAIFIIIKIHMCLQNFEISKTNYSKHFEHFTQESIVGSVVECSPATRAARVRFPDDAVHF